ncbi:MAG TPA: TIGR03617 family F420-dependent LLM class oxidoreductase [Candidatus Binatia bacterium]|nr:TIGR03617 family F420-dependent LLM class oxidoreductase [Candidatus Binatia bacterium]
MRVETGLPLGNWRSVAAAARSAEAAGFDGVLSYEIGHDPFAPLVIAATATERVRLGTAIAVCFPRSPMVMANIARDLHAESGGRFTLGLGTQVKGHNERRFSVPWTAPLPRLREYIEALRAIWRCWETGEKLAYEGKHYTFTLMTPEFSPPPTGLGPVPITIAAVKPAMMGLAGRICDGIRLHGFATRRYLETVAMPALEEGLRSSARERANFEIWGGGFIATGKDEAAVAESLEKIRYRVAFYGSTRSYHGVLEVHGAEDLGNKLHDMSKAGKWREMAREVPDDLLREFVVAATWRELPAAVSKRFGGITDSITLDLPADMPVEQRDELLAELKAIPAAFRGFAAR